MTRRKLGLAVLLAALIPAGCGGAPAAPDLSSLRVGMSYDAVVTTTGSHCERIHDRGVRVLRWLYEDGTAIEATIHDGGLSGMKVLDPASPAGRARERIAGAAGLQSDMPEDALRARLGDDPVTLDDESDRECRWAFRDGTLTAVFIRGDLREAEWLAAEDAVPVVLAEVADEVEPLLADLASYKSWDRSRALQRLENVEDPRLAPAVLNMLRVETDRLIRGKAAKLLAKIGDPRASDLLLVDLEHEIIYDDVLDALGEIGDMRAAMALDAAYLQDHSPRTKGRIRAARRRIERRLGVKVFPDR